MKILVVCIDGTGQRPGQTAEDPVKGIEYEKDTNVVRTWEALTDSKLNSDRPYGEIAPLPKQPAGSMAIYLNGVGSEGIPIERLAAGATGAGTSERIKDAYRFLSKHWLPGDKIYGFGFSRGAFAVRSLAGFINRVGLSKSNYLMREDELQNLYQQYMSTSTSQERNARTWDNNVQIEFLGLWDTVGALAFRDLLNNYHDTSPLNVNQVYHALALDERRMLWRPEEWKHGVTSQHSKDSPHIEEVWFAGTHTNVGGGFSDPNLSNIALFWVLYKATKNGLKLDLRGITGWHAEDVHGDPKPTYAETWGSMFGVEEFLAALGIGAERRRVLPSQRLHESVIDAMKERSYRPAALWHDGVTEITPSVADGHIEQWGL